MGPITGGLDFVRLVVNKCPPSLEPDAVKQKVEKAYGCAVSAVIPHSDEMMNLASSGIFVLEYPDHPLVSLYHQIAEGLW